MNKTNKKRLLSKIYGMLMLSIMWKNKAWKGLERVCVLVDILGRVLREVLMRR